MDPLFEVDLTTATAFPSAQEFETAASTQDKNEVHTHVPGLLERNNVLR